VAVPDSALISTAPTQRAACPVWETVTISGWRCSHWATANSHRGRKKQPGGRLPGRGGLPYLSSSPPVKMRARWWQ
jgi:hypothetical protein